jgi:hypothetical protein
MNRKLILSLLLVSVFAFVLSISIASALSYSIVGGTVYSGGSTWVANASVIVICSDAINGDVVKFIPRTDSRGHYATVFLPGSQSCAIGSQLRVIAFKGNLLSQKIGTLGNSSVTLINIPLN